MIAGQPSWQSAGQTGGFPVNPIIEKKLFHDSRQLSVIGKLSRIVADENIGLGPKAQDTPVSDSITLTQIITRGDEARFTMAQNLGGGVVFGDKLPPAGDYQAYLHTNVFINLVKCPAYPIPEIMSRQRIAGVLDDYPAETKQQIADYFSEQYTMDWYQSALRGASLNLLASFEQGGRNLDLGLGAGVQVSPQHFLCAGTGGFVSGVSGTQAFEDALVVELSELTDDDSHHISHSFIAGLDALIDSRKILPISGSTLNGFGAGKKMFVCLCDPELMYHLSKPGSELSEEWKVARQRGKDNPIFMNEGIQLGRFIFYPDPWLAKFRPSISAGAVVWGQNDQDNDKRDYTSDSQIGLMIVCGANAMMEGTNGDLHFTYDPGKHEVGETYSAYVKQSFKRTRWTAKDGRPLSNSTLRERGMLVVAFHCPGISI